MPVRQSPAARWLRDAGPASRSAALKERFEGKTELVPDDEDSFESVPLHTFGNQRVNLVGLVSTSGRSQVVEKIDDRFPHMPVAELLKCLLVEVLRSARDICSAVASRELGPGRYCFPFGNQVSRRVAASWKTVFPKTSSPRPARLSALSNPRTKAVDRRPPPPSAYSGTTSHGRHVFPLGTNACFKDSSEALLLPCPQTAPDLLKRGAVEAVTEEAGEDGAQAALTGAVSTVADDGASARDL